MSLRHELHSLDDLVAQLPYELDDTTRAGQDFVRWKRTGSPAARRLVDLWTYCYVRRFYLVKFMREPGLRDADLEAVVEQAYRNVERGREDIREAERYARWVSVVCRRTYLSHVSRRRVHAPVDRVAEPADDAPTPGDLHDSVVVLGAVLAAIARLPTYLQEVAQLKFIHDLTPDEIGRRLGKAPPTIRAYVHKAVVRFRADKLLHRTLGDSGYESDRSASRGESTTTDPDRT